MNNPKYNLEERTSCFGEKIINFCQNLSQNTITLPIINQLIRSGTSIGANYREANAASSRQDFRNKIFICKKEAQETQHWLRMILSCNLNKKIEVEILSQECKELVLIFGKIIFSLKRNSVSKFEIKN